MKKNTFLVEVKKTSQTKSVKKKEVDSITKVIELIGQYLEDNILEILGYNITIYRDGNLIAKIDNKGNRFTRGRENFFDIENAKEEEYPLFFCLFANKRIKDITTLLAAKQKGWL